MRTPRRTPTAGPETPSGQPPRGRRAHAGPPADEPVDDLDGIAADNAPTRPAGWRLRPRTVRAKVVCLLMVPVMSLLALWAYATVTTAQDVSRLRQSQRVDAALRTPVAAAVAALQAERAAAVRYATDPAAEQTADLKRLGARTDQAVAALRLGKDSTVADSEELPSGVAQRLKAFVTGAEQLRTLRRAVQNRGTGWDAAYGQYTQAIASAFAVDGALTGIQADDMGSDARVLLELSRAGEALAQEDAVLGGARLAGGLDGERLRLFTGAVGTRRVLTDAAVPDLPGAQRTAWHRLADGDDYTALSAAEDRILASSPGAKAAGAVPEATWNTAHTRVQDGMRNVQAGTAHAVA
ncbi:nitrate- and nitrite sensing domain-containing protein, partial [Streptomyces hyaluromycini]